VTEEFLHCAKWGDHTEVKTFKRIETPEGVTFEAAE
jgi:hypothetical protein